MLYQNDVYLDEDVSKAYSLLALKIFIRHCVTKCRSEYAIEAVKDWRRLNEELELRYTPASILALQETF